jgi:hypothetical protein
MVIADDIWDKPDDVRRIAHVAIYLITVEFVAEPAPSFIDGGGVCSHAKSTMDVREVVIGTTDI